MSSFLQHDAYDTISKHV